MSTARHHAEWLSLLEISGPFLSMPVLMNAFPQGLDAVSAEVAAELRAVYEEWADNQGGLRPDPAIHTAWIRYVLTTILEMPEQTIVEGQAIPGGLKADVAEHHETLRPDLVIRDPDSGRPCLLVQLYPADQGLEKAIPGSRWQAAPATRMMELLHATETRLGLVTNGEQWLLVQAKRGETTGFAGWYAPLWLEERLTLRAFRSLLAASRFFGVPDDQTLEALLDQSAQDQAEVTDQLGYQVRQAVEILVQSIDEIDQDRDRTLLHEVSEERLYEAALTVMMRLVFLLAAEERGLLLLGDPVYDQFYAVSTLRAQLRDAADRHGEEVLGRGFDAWCRLLATWRAVYGGINHENLHLPAYGGSLFDPDRFPFLEGRAAGSEWRSTTADPLPIDNRTVLHLLEALQMLQMKTPGGGPTQARRLSFRALDIEQIGHVYEGLLDHRAVRAADPVLGLQGTRDKEPEIPMPVLEAQLAKGEYALVAFLRDQTGRSESALRKVVRQNDLDREAAARLQVACDNDTALLERVRPWAGLLRVDDFGYPIVVPAGSVYVTAGSTRRATGTHYTPRSLTEPIVQHTLEPQVYRGPAEGTPRDQWQLKTPAELLELKVCDMAMGSGAFLVQACRYLSERLVEAWGEAARGDLQITPEGRPATGDPAETIIPGDPEERLALARRLVADRCLYGVDKNPLAVEMAKLSLWLITLDKGRPFTFLDHALKHGDSLVGADEEMFLRWSQSLKGTIGPLYFEQNERAVAEARRLRQQLQAMPERDVRDAEQKARLYRESEAALARVKLGCDLLVGVELVEGLKPVEREMWRAELLIEYTAKEMPTSDKAQRALAAARALPVLHWPFEFPEVFERGGFDAFVGNPPYMHGSRVSSRLGDEYLQWLLQQYENSLGKADLCTYFVRNAYALLQAKGALGLVLTNSIAEGENLKAGIDQIVRLGAIVFAANPDKPWQGKASVIITELFIFKGNYSPPYLLNGKPVSRISNRLTSDILEEPIELIRNTTKCYKGSELLGDFYVSEQKAQQLIAADDKLRQAVKPFIGGQQFTTSPTQQPDRWVLYLGDRTLDQAEAEFPLIVDILRKRFFSGSLPSENMPPRKNWWQFHRTRSVIYKYAEENSLSSFLLRPYTSNVGWFEFGSTKWIVSNALVVVLSESHAIWSILNSTIHEEHTLRYASRLKTDIRYTPTTCYGYFPFPDDARINSLIPASMEYHSYRKQVIEEHNKGLRDLYNWFHNSSNQTSHVNRIRYLHSEVDHAVAAAYGWTDLDLGHGFHETPQGVRYTISEPARREVLARLLQLNHERYEEEVKAGLHEKKAGAKGRKGAGEKKSKKGGGQMSLL